ncbi:DUF885 domain-containing protein [Naasia aerilata]|uniref:DUF885 domain-containing protein n=1 Tax=Naasia aerilata TaxID=1162966 RepID=A0ABN6XTM9_9MICO|nr:DUF885 domain-containing protein [Naasia aerilata]BDZ47011.1 hypothetical protein GCM10025866_29200 [Naasia aerilata]
MTEERVPTEIDRIADGWVDTLVELSPEMGIWLGRPGNEGAYSDYSPEGRERIIDTGRKVASRLRETSPADPVDEVTRTDLLRELDLASEKHEAGFAFRDLNVIASPAQDIREVFDLMPTGTETAWEHVAQRLGNLPAALAGYTETLRRGVELGTVPAIRQVREVALQAKGHAAADGFFFTLVGGAAVDGVPVTDTLRRDLEAGATAAAVAYGEFADFLERELAPRAPEQDAVGREIYALASRDFLGATIDLDETYEWGQDELRRMVEEQEAIARDILPGATIPEVIAHLEQDPSRKLHGTDALQRWMQDLSDRAIEALGRTHFDIPAEVRTLECRIAPTQTGGVYYTGPSDDFARPGRMWWSVPAGVTEFDTWHETTTVYHEGVPGHHLQIGIATYNKAQLNSWRRIAGTSGHAEGWALYAERLMDSLGYLDEPADRFGMLDGQRLRAARVVVDIGVHLGKKHPDGGTWTGDQVFPFLRANSTWDDASLRFEGNRYLGWPGQAPAYKVGQRIWEQLRDEVQRREGADFSIKRFHRRALDVGGVGLDTLRAAILGAGQ